MKFCQVHFTEAPVIVRPLSTVEYTSVASESFPQQTVV